MNNAQKSFEELTVSDVCEKLSQNAKEAKKLMIISHVNPDGDTIGCAFALKLIYIALGGEAKCVCSTDGAPYLHFLYNGQDSIEFVPGEDKNFDIIYSVDTASPKQLGKLEDIKDKIEVMIDHHSSGQPYADNLIDPAASAAGELIFDIYSSLCKSGKINKNSNIARCIYAAISSDTGSFMYSNTTSKTHICASELVSEINQSDDDPDTAEIARLLHQNETKSDLAAKKLAIENLKYAADGTVAYVLITSEMMVSNSLCELDLGGIVDLPRCVEGVLVGVSIKQSRTDPKVFRISSRSNCDINVAKVCEIFGGGGHVRAAGASLNANSPEEAESLIISAFAKASEEYIAARQTKK